ncbi:hypothetical protein TrLO_g15035 [Triparma laevis f. longispina]|uniref:Uncharacterized protein n=1 Tax=Triparma laevis f. longispina TaxID=1714387 RepID=A0A9W7DXY3_9STRA|nr:hypothetical protein TrLO_g15035 [Triparma laevis f. longispina]
MSDSGSSQSSAMFYPNGDSPLFVDIFVITVTCFAGLYATSIIIVPVDTILSPSDPYSLSNSTAVWALACEFISGGLVTFMISQHLRTRPRFFLRLLAVASLIGQTLTGVALWIACPAGGGYSTLGEVLYYIAHITFIGPTAVMGFTLGTIYSLRRLPERGWDFARASGMPGFFVSIYTIVWMWVAFFYLSVVQVGTIAKGYGRLDIFYYGWGIFLFVTLTLSSFMWTAPQPTVTLVGSNLDTSEPKDSLDQKDVMSGRGRGAFWPYFFVYVVTLVPGLGLKLLSGPILQISYGFPMWAQTIVTTVYIALYGISRVINPLFCKTPSQVKKMYAVTRSEATKSELR